jgi:hypothetical protein
LLDAADEDAAAAAAGLAEEARLLPALPLPLQQLLPLELLLLLSLPPLLLAAAAAAAGAWSFLVKKGREEAADIVWRRQLWGCVGACAARS